MHQKITKQLLTICEQLLYGALTIKLPQGDSFSFVGQFPGPKATLNIKDYRVLNNLLAKGDTGFGEDYVEGLWDSDNLPSLLSLVALNEAIFTKYLYGNNIHKLFYRFKHKLQANTIAGSYSNITKHYDLSNEFFRLWLDSSMTYSSALFKSNFELSLESAQQAKYDRIFYQLNIQPRESVLDIGCGWGALAEYLARKNVNVTAITLSEEQANFANQRITNNHFEELVNIRLEDYRNTTGIYDYIISIGMFEHVGKSFWSLYFKVIATHLKRTGKAMIQTIVSDEKFYGKQRNNVTNFLQHYIFPGGDLPSHTSFISEANKAGLVCKKSYPFGHDYALTLMHWLTRFEDNIEKIKALGFDQKFIKGWRFYLAYAMAGFVSKRTNVVQFELEHI